MAKIVYALLTVFAIELGLFMYAGATYGATSLLNILSDPSDILSNPFYLAIIAVIGVFAAAIVVSGTFFNINIYALYAGMILIFITFIHSIASLWSFLYGQLSGYGIGPILQESAISSLAGQVATFAVAPILIGYIIASVEWIRSNQ